MKYTQNLTDDMKKYHIKRDKRKILVFEDERSVFNIVKTLKENSNYFNNDMKKILLENFYENIKLMYGYSKFYTFFKKKGIDRNMDLNNKKDRDLLYDLLIRIVKENEYNYDIFRLFYNHRSQEFYRKDLCKKDGIIADMDRIIDETFWVFACDWIGFIDKLNKK